MKVVFAGTPEFARIAYEAIVQVGFAVPLVLTQPDRPAGRGMKLTSSPVKDAALLAGSQVVQPISLRLDGKYPEQAQYAKQLLEQLAPDVIVVAAYGLILPQWLLDLPQYGCLNIHASLLPRWRGAAPIQRAIEAGDEMTGINIIQMDAGLDTGPVLLEQRVAIGVKNAGQLHDCLAKMGAQLIVEALRQLTDGTLTPREQDNEGVYYAHKISKSEAVLSWSASAIELHRKIRAFNPVPGVVLPLPGIEQAVKVWQAQALDQDTVAQPGAVLKATAVGIDIATAQGVLRILELQKPGGKKQTAAQFVQGWKF